jgi:hypothetical protein
MYTRILFHTRNLKSPFKPLTWVTRCEKIAQNVSQPIFVKIIYPYIIYTLEKCCQNCGLLLLFFKKMPKANNHPLGKNSLSLVNLPLTGPSLITIHQWSTGWGAGLPGGDRPGHGAGVRDRGDQGVRAHRSRSLRTVSWTIVSTFVSFQSGLFWGQMIAADQRSLFVKVQYIECRNVKMSKWNLLTSKLDITNIPAIKATTRCPSPPSPSKILMKW